MTTAGDEAVEAGRLAALDWYDLRPDLPEAPFDDIVRLAALVFDAPQAFVTIVGRDRIWFKSAVGDAPAPIARDGAFCAATVETDAMLVVADATLDPRFASNPLVTGEAGVRFYAGAPIRTPEGHRVGSLCVLDTRPRRIDDARRDALRVLADQIAGLVAKRRHTLEMAHRGALLELVRRDLSRREDAVPRIVETAARALGVDRVGLWFFNEDRSSIVVEDQYIASEARHERGARLTAADHPVYFAALAEARVIAADDACRDPRTREFEKTYLEPFDVRSMLDVPVRSEGVVVGILCHEHVGSARTWSPGDEEFAGSVADLVGTVLEASRRRRSEEELRVLAASLERRVEQRTVDLEASNRALTRAVNDLEAFCYSVSHDLRGPLRVINGFATMLAEAASADKDEEAAEGIARIRENSNRMSELLDGLLSFFRLGRRPMDVALVDMDGLLRETVSSLDLDTTAVLFEAAPLLPVEGDRALLADVLANLLSNAFKFSARRPSPRVEIGCECLDGEVVYVVRDNGIGFREDHAARLFEPFQRLHARDGYDGTGVGLAIVRRIVERHGGRVWAESAPSKGATFRFSLPLQQGAER